MVAMCFEDHLGFGNFGKMAVCMEKLIWQFLRKIPALARLAGHVVAITRRGSLYICIADKTSSFLIMKKIFLK